jgi:uncharacterized Zn-binding protein involved in type VI secretion
MGDKISGTCAIHLVPNPATGAPQPGPPLPFSAPLTTGLATTVLIEGKPAAVVGAGGYNTPPHVGLHPSDPFMVPTAQVGSVVMGSATVIFENKPAAKTGSSCTICGGVPGTLTGTAVTVLIGG